MPLWALTAILAGLLLAAGHQRIAARLGQPRGHALDRYAPSVLRITVILAGACLVAIGFSAL